jgi:metal-responsive CopG/Arc/MetJ family transcriptional regulator
MDTVRLNVTLPREIAEQLDNLAGPKKKSRFIAETLRQRIEKIQNERLQVLLEEGYKSTRQESLALAREFELVDLEGWDEY